MYNETYDDYIRSILGYQPVNAYDDYTDYRNQNINYEDFQNNTIDLERGYPEIYKVLYPMITTKCNNVNIDSITDEDIMNMTDEIYNAFEDTDKRQNINNEKDTDKRQTNGVLRDLIQILLIRELLNRRKRPRPPYPPMPGPGPRPPRPPMQGPGSRPPMRPNFRI